LENTEPNSAVAGVLIDLSLARLAFLAKLHERGNYDGHQRQDDARRNVGHDVEGENRRLLERTAREQVEHAQEAARLPGHILAHGRSVDTGGRDEDPDPVDSQHSQREENAAAELGNSKDVRDGAHGLLQAFS